MSKAFELAIAMQEEAKRAVKLHGDFNSLHEAYAVILEELDEIWDIVKLKAGERNIVDLRKELIQLGAMCTKTIDYIDKGKYI